MCAPPTLFTFPVPAVLSEPSIGGVRHCGKGRRARGVAGRGARRYGHDAARAGAEGGGRHAATSSRMEGDDCGRSALHIAQATWLSMLLKVHIGQFHILLAPSSAGARLCACDRRPTVGRDSQCAQRRAGCRFLAASASPGRHAAIRSLRAVGGPAVGQG